MKRLNILLLSLAIAISASAQFKSSVWVVPEDMLYSYTQIAFNFSSICRSMGVDREEFGPILKNWWDNNGKTDTENGNTPRMYVTSTANDFKMYTNKHDGFYFSTTDAIDPCSGKKMTLRVWGGQAKLDLKMNMLYLNLNMNEDIIFGFYEVPFAMADLQLQATLVLEYKDKMATFDITVNMTDRMRGNEIPLITLDKVGEKAIKMKYVAGRKCSTNLNLDSIAACFGEDVRGGNLQMCAYADAEKKTLTDRYTYIQQVSIVLDDDFVYWQEPYKKRYFSLDFLPVPQEILISPFQKSYAEGEHVNGSVFLVADGKYFELKMDVQFGNSKQKTWKVGWFPMSTSKTPQMVATYYFDGDTIVNGQKAKRMLCDQVATSEWEGLNTSKEYVGAWYEQDKQVYCAFPGEDQFRKLYDFTTNVNERFFVYNRQTGSEEESYLNALYTDWTNNYKGVTHVVGSYPNAKLWSTTWLEGIGSLSIPTANIVDETNGYKLISCKEGDEVIYLDEQLEADIPTGPSYAKKRRFDFNHTIKTQPKTPRRAGELDGLYGEYNNELLDVKLNPLDDAYLVRITDKSGKAVYEKTINAGNIVALNIDISSYPDGQYTVTIENSKETFTGEFDTTATGIEKNVKIEKLKNANIYNLQGQRIETLQKGLNIVDGMKIWVK